MGRTALVAGGMREIGTSITTALLDGDYTVAVSYHGNDQAAEDFNATAGIPVFKWDVAETADWAVVFLVSDDAGFIAGSTLTVNGGQHMN